MMTRAASRRSCSREQPVEAGDADVVQAIDRVAHQLRGDAPPLRRRAGPPCRRAATTIVPLARARRRCCRSVMVRASSWIRCAGHAVRARRRRPRASARVTSRLWPRADDPLGDGGDLGRRFALGRRRLREIPGGARGGDRPGRSRDPRTALWRRTLKQPARAASGVSAPDAHLVEQGAELQAVHGLKRWADVDFADRAGLYNHRLCRVTDSSLYDACLKHSSSSLYFFVLIILAIYGWHRYYLVYLYMKNKDKAPRAAAGRSTRAAARHDPAADLQRDVRRRPPDRRGLRDRLPARAARNPGARRLDRRDARASPSWRSAATPRRASTSSTSTASTAPATRPARSRPG